MKTYKFIIRKDGAELDMYFKTASKSEAMNKFKLWCKMCGKNHADYEIVSVEVVA